MTACAEGAARDRAMGLTEETAPRRVLADYFGHPMQQVMREPMGPASEPDRGYPIVHIRRSKLTNACRAH